MPTIHTRQVVDYGQAQPATRHLLVDADAALEDGVALVQGDALAIRLHIHGAQQGETLSAADVAAAQAGSRRSEIWFCGPQGLAEKLKQELGRIGQGRFSFHQEAFEMR